MKTLSTIFSSIENGTAGASEVIAIVLCVVIFFALAIAFSFFTSKKSAL